MLWKWMNEWMGPVVSLPQCVQSAFQGLINEQTFSCFNIDSSHLHLMAQRRLTYSDCAGHLQIQSAAAQSDKIRSVVRCFAVSHHHSNTTTESLVLTPLTKISVLMGNVSGGSATCEKHVSRLTKSLGNYSKVNDRELCSSTFSQQLHKWAKSIKEKYKNNQDLINCLYAFYFWLCCSLTLVCLCLLRVGSVHIKHCATDLQLYYSGERQH